MQYFFLPFVVCRLWRLIGFHAIDVDYHLNTVGIKLFYMWDKIMITFPCNVQCKRYHDRWLCHCHHRAVLSNCVWPMVHEPDDTIHDNYHNNVSRTVHTQRLLFLVPLHTFDTVMPHVRTPDRLSIPLCDTVEDFVLHRRRRTRFSDTADMLMSKRHRQTVEIAGLASLVFPRRSLAVMYKSHLSRLHLKCSLCRLYPDRMKYFPTYLNCPCCCPTTNYFAVE